jgi:hypothetical protein
VLWALLQEVEQRVLEVTATKHARAAGAKAGAEPRSESKTASHAPEKRAATKSRTTPGAAPWPMTSTAPRATFRAGAITWTIAASPSHRGLRRIKFTEHLCSLLLANACANGSFLLRSTLERVFCTSLRAFADKDISYSRCLVKSEIYLFAIWSKRTASVYLQV